MQTLLDLKCQPLWKAWRQQNEAKRVGPPLKAKMQKRAFKNTSRRRANGLGSSMTREETKLLANLHHGLIKDLPRGNNCKAKFKRPKIRCKGLTLIERSRERHLTISLYSNNLS